MSPNLKIVGAPLTEEEIVDLNITITPLHFFAVGVDDKQIGSISLTDCSKPNGEWKFCRFVADSKTEDSEIGTGFDSKALAVQALIQSWHAYTS